MTEAANTIRITELQKELLAAVFIRLKAQEWKKVSTKGYITAILNQIKNSEDTAFANLNVGQLRRQYNSYLSTLNLRKEIGLAAYDTTTQMIDGTFGDHFITEILLSLRKLTNKIHPRLSSLLPKTFSTFLDRIAIHYDDQSILLSDIDKAHIKSFSIFNQKILIRIYRKLWGSILTIEQGELAKGGTHNIDSILSDYELTLLEYRISQCNDNKSDIWNIFFSIPILKESIGEPTDIKVMYPDYDAQFLNMYPIWLKAIVGENGSIESKLALQKCIIGMYEMLVYEYYCKAFGLQRYCDDINSIKDIEKELKDPDNKDEDYDSDGSDNNGNREDVDDRLELTYNNNVSSIIYYISCAAYRKMTGVLLNKYTPAQETLLINRLHKSFLLLPSAAEREKLPISRVKQNEKILNKLLYINRTLFDIMISIEKEILEKWFSNTKVLIILCNDFSETLRFKVKNMSDGYVELETMILSAFIDDEEIQKEFNDEEIKSIVQLLLNKFIDYYINTACGDFNKKVIPLLRQYHKTVNNKNIPWRLLLQMTNVKKSLTKE